MRVWAGLLSTVLCVACAGDDAGSEDVPGGSLGIDDGASRGETRRASIDRNKATTIQMSTGASLSVPVGAARERVDVQMERMPDRDGARLAANVMPSYRLASATYALTPHGTQFDVPVELTLRVARGDPSRARMAALDDEHDETWEIIPARAGASAGAVVSTIMHFSVYALLEELASDDAGTGAGAGSDAGSFVMNDAGRDASSIIDSGGGDATMTLIDANMSYVDSSVAEARDANVDDLSYSARLAAKIRGCNLVGIDGVLNVEFGRYEPDDAVTRCKHECLLSGSCANVQADTCERSGIGGNFDQDMFDTCVDACFSHPLEAQCLGPTGAPTTSLACNGQTECADGSDEAYCAEKLWPCVGGGQVHWNERCDGTRSCQDGSDEVGCASFNCTDGLGSVPMHHVCDFQRDCEDGSDELQNCLQLVCPNPT